MQGMQKRHFILTALGASPLIAYSFLFFGMMIEGDLLVFTAGFLIHRGELDLMSSFLVALAGSLLGDALWYALGRVNTENNRFLAWLGSAADKVGNRIDTHIIDRTFRTLFISKFIYGVHHFTLVRAGRRDVLFRKILRSDIPASVLWIGIVGSIGYLASASFDLARRRVHVAEIILLFGLALYLILAEVIGRLLKKKL